jgi:pimeloyl-ACP methyl ester carboxylesterase
MMRWTTPRAALAAALSLALADGAAAQSADIMQVREIGSFHIGGKPVSLEGLPVREVVFSPGMAPIRVDPNGDFHAEQMYVQYVKLAAPRARYPLLMWHGGGLTGVTWETKPDGQPGWQQFFLRQGHDVYVSDAVERGRASWSRFPEIFKGEPIFRTKKEAWELFRIGPNGSYRQAAGERVAHPGAQFPTQAFDLFALQSVPRWTTTDPATHAAYKELVERVCPCVVMVHSQGGNFGFTAALGNPEKVKAVIAVEPSGAPKADDPALAKLKNVPHLFVWGDYLDAHPVWINNVVKAPTAYHEALVKQGTKSEWVDLPKVGVTGNSHMVMMDRNSDRVAQLVQDWMAKQGLMR